MNTRTFYYYLLFLTVLLACKGKKTDYPDSHYISIPSLIREQVNHIDTALYSIMKVVTTDSLSDTSYVSRENFEAEAKEFLEIPDLSDDKLAARYTPDSLIYDETLNRVIVTYNANDPNEPFTRQQLLITPHPGSTDKVNSVMATYVKTNKNGSLRKDMLWLLDHSFQVVTISQMPGQAERTTTKKVTWNDQPDE